MGVGDFVSILDSVHLDAACEGIDVAKGQNDIVPQSKSESDDASPQKLLQSESPA